jgi:hypothetical protein
LVHKFDFAARQQPVPLAQMRGDADLAFLRNFHAQILRALWGNGRQVSVSQRAVIAGNHDAGNRLIKGVLLVTRQALEAIQDRLCLCAHALKAYALAVGRASATTAGYLHVRTERLAQIHSPLVCSILVISPLSPFPPVQFRVNRFGSLFPSPHRPPWSTSSLVISFSYFMY